MNAQVITEDVIKRLEKRFGKPRQLGRARILTFGKSITCSINYSKQLGHKFFYAVSAPMLSSNASFPQTELGEFVLLICGSADEVLVLPRQLVLEMLQDVPSRRIDVFVDSGTYILQTTQHPKRDVTEYLNAYPKTGIESQHDPEANDEQTLSVNRVHVRIQWSLIRLGLAEGWSVWVPTNDRNLAYKAESFSKSTLSRLPNFGFDQNTRRIVENIDVLWLQENVIRKAFEIESTTSIYSGLLRLNDLVLSQPNNQIDLFVAAPKKRRSQVEKQFLRPTFRPLITACEFVSFESIEKEVQRVESLLRNPKVRISGLIHGERFSVPTHYVYPGDFN